MELDPGPKSRYHPPGRDVRTVVLWIVLGGLVATAAGAGGCVACVGFGSSELEEAPPAVEDRGP